ncbi:MAG: hypothetical protein CL605_02320 [Altibacter sp.]|uniref:hypothetical protein n=1 Tax=Altibacter sp. TaxID=2024823 RepID=UPI000C957024|nr:hypothetical protein [Altibacter sp.]MAP53716.1 hypothetical protein [Altibacter sp.]|tara:strand:+ start:12854 stop:13054 length:201 start_codon:yes stop_codon:yes gene_type:complete
MPKIDVLLHCKICEKNVLVKNKYKYFTICGCGNIEVDAHLDRIKIDKVSYVKWKIKDEWIDMLEEE